MELRPISIRHASTFVREHHRHHEAPRGAKFALAAWHEGQLVGVAMIGRPVSRALDNGTTAEVIRVATGRYAERLFISLRCREAGRSSDGLSKSRYLHTDRGKRGEPARGWLAACRCRWRRFVVATESAACRRSSITAKNTVGGCILRGWERVTLADIQRREWASATKTKRTKYGAVKTLHGGILFDSKAECKRWIELLWRRQANEIDQLERQVPYEIRVAGILIATWFADFRYREFVGQRGPVREYRIVVEDVKSEPTRKNRTYRLKKKLVEALYGITITEVIH